MSVYIDINCDMGESYGRWTLGNDEEVMPHITSANIACGFHGGDPHVMRKTVALALQYGVAGLKTAMTLAGYQGTTPRLPLEPVGPDVEEELRAMLRQLETFTGWTLASRDGRPDGPAETHS